MKLKKLRMTESQKQKLIVRWMEMNRIVFFHVPNGGTRNALEGANLKRQGVKAGVPDIVIPIPRKPYHGLFLELKRDEKSLVSENQKKWIEKLIENGYLAVVKSEDWQEITKFISNYLNLEKW
jgi:hypothetical protein